MRNARLKKEAKKLFEDGLEPTEIIERLRDLGTVSNPTVYRWINEFREELEDDSDESNEDTPDENEFQDDPNETHDTPNEDAELLETIRAKKRRALKQARKTLRKLLAIDANHKWEHKQVVDFLEELENIQDQVESALKYDPDLYEENLLWNVVTDCINLFENLIISGDKIPVLHSDILDIEKSIFLKLLIGIEEFDEPYNLEMDFVAKCKTLLIQVFNNNYVNEERQKSLCSQLHELLQYSEQIGLGDEFEEDIDNLKLLKNVLNECEEKLDNSWSGSVKLKLDPTLKEKLLKMAENNVFELNS